MTPRLSAHARDLLARLCVSGLQTLRDHERRAADELAAARLAKVTGRYAVATDTGRQAHAGKEPPR